MALGTYIVGAYTATLASVALGQTAEGYEVQVEPHQEMLNRSDIFGEMLFDTIYRGIDFYAQMEFQEYKAGPIAAMNPFGALGVQGIIGRLGSDIATALVLTATAGTPAAATPATMTANKSLLAPNSQPRFGMHSRLRTIPMRFVLLPYDAGSGVIKNLVTT